MNRTIKKVAIIATIVIGIGLILATIGGLSGGFSFVHIGNDGIYLENKNAKPEDFITKKQTLNSFSNVNIDVDFYNIEFIKSDKYAVEYSYYKKMNEPVIRVADGKLTISEVEKHGIISDLEPITRSTASRIKIFYPADAMFEQVMVQSGAGELEIHDLNANRLEAELDFGNMILSNMNMNALDLSLSAGDCDISNVTTKNAEISLDLGSLKAKNFNSKGLEVENNAGDITLQGTFEGENSIGNDLGNITVNTTLPESQYNYELEIDLGNATVNGMKQHNNANKNNGAPNTMELECAAGDIALNFQ